jgi:hypothetical protein
MVVPWAATQLDREDSESSDGYRSLVGRRVQLPRDIGSDRTKVGADLLAAFGYGHRRWRAVLGVDAWSDNVQWVLNVRAAGGKAVLRSGGRDEIQLEELPVDQRAPILKAYLQRAPGARPHVPVNKDAALAEFQKVAAAFPVFRLASNKPAARSR